VPVARDCVQRIKKRRLEVGNCTEEPKSFCPNDGFYSMQAGGKQDRGTDDDHEPANGLAMLSNPTGSADGSSADEPEAQHMDHHRQDNKRQTPGPVGTPGSGVNAETSESGSRN
jgi:hypothetical protein